MHQQAILTTNHATLGNIGDPVSIAALEKLFQTSHSANNGIKYKCADPNCGIRVKAVITVLAKQKRKSSPSSYFAAKETSHVKGCTRMPKPQQPTNTSTSTITTGASPNRTARPVVWVDPRDHATTLTGTSSVGTGLGSEDGESGRGRNSQGSGTSKGRSQMVESYAVEWLNMTNHEKQSDELKAPWNPGGTYFSAFHPIWFYSSIDVTTLGEKIFVGTFKSAIKSKTGYVITLAEKNTTGEKIWVWVQSQAFAIGSAGKALERLLDACVKSPANYVGKKVFALEKFSRQSGGKGSWSSIPVSHPHMMWIE